MDKWKIDVNVLLIFFIRDEAFSKVFEAVKNAKPRRLLLWQDGPRDNRPDDLVKIRKCRDIAENIDWDCEVYKMYNEKNYGCDPSTFYSHKWAFSIVDKCIVLEDDVVPSQSFFPYCKELLERYENDTRINRICGQNNVPGHYCPNSYFFSTIGSVWGWATWKRVADSWKEKYEFLEDEYTMKCYRAAHNSKGEQAYLKTCQLNKQQGVAHWEKIQTYSRHLNHQLVIVPSKTLITNVGLGTDSTHSNCDDSDISPIARKMFYRSAEEMTFPLVHPEYIVDDVIYKNEFFELESKDRRTGFLRSVGRTIKKIKNGDFKGVRTTIKNRLGF